jgi:hypothetical protein
MARQPTRSQTKKTPKSSKPSKVQPLSPCTPLMIVLTNNCLHFLLALGGELNQRWLHHRCVFNRIQPIFHLGPNRTYTYQTSTTQTNGCVSSSAWCVVASSCYCSEAHLMHSASSWQCGDIPLPPTSASLALSTHEFIHLLHLAL